jgi:hypothetical protein
MNRSLSTRFVSSLWILKWPCLTSVTNICAVWVMAPWPVTGIASPFTIKKVGEFNSTTCWILQTFLRMNLEYEVSSVGYAYLEQNENFQVKSFPIVSSGVSWRYRSKSSVLEVLSSNPGRYTSYKDTDSLWFSSIPLGKCLERTSIMPWPLLSKSFPVHYYPVILYRCRV